MSEAMYSESEVDAALCIWERALEPSATDHIKRRSATDFLEFLKEGEGFAQARDNALHLAKFCELSYIYATHHGWDDSFDWEFVPRWVDLAMVAFESPCYMADERGISWSVWAGKEIAEDHSLAPSPKKL